MITDYRAFCKSKLVEVESKQADLEREREGILSALGLLDEADSKSIRGKISPQKHLATHGVTLADTIVSVLSERATATNEIYERVVPKYETSKKTMVASLYRLRKRGELVGKGGLWRLPVSRASTEQPPQP